MPNQVRVGVGVTGARGAASEMDRLRDKVAKLQKTSAKGLLTGFAAGVGIGAINAVGTAIHEVTGFLGDSSAAYRENQVAAAKLAASLNANTRGAGEYASALDDASKAAVNLGFTDNETTDALAKMVAATHSAKEAIDLLAAAQDLARFKGISLGEATDALTKIEGGSFRILKSLGINLKAGATQTEALAAVMKVAGGQARAFANTDLGLVTIESAKAEAAQEKFGKVLSGIGTKVIPIATDALTTLATAFDNLFTQMDSNATPLAKMKAQLAAIEASGQAADGGAQIYIRTLKEQIKALEGASAAAATHGDELIGVRTSARGVTDAEREAAAAIDDAGEAARVATRKNHELASSFDVLHDSVQSQIDQLENLDHATRAQEAIDALKKWKAETKNLTAEQQDLYNQLLKNYERAKLFAAITYKGVVYTGANPLGTHRAMGGPVAAGVPYKVGEQGTETFVPETNGTIIPHGKGMASPAMGGDTHLHFHVETPVATPGSMQELARLLTPVIAREMQRGGLIPRSA